MLKEVLINDEIGEFLVEKINLTQTQLDTLLITLLNNDKSNLNKMISRRDNRKVSKGSFIRTLKQAKKNVESSLFTLIILEYFSIIEENQINNLIKIGNTLKNISDNVSADKDINIILDHVSSTISSVCNKK
jgi:hypothetical protein|tara:strand:+ start:5070 stop:5465 length:396 start_codon:yes stop_codon:yes gene_type:complete